MVNKLFVGASTPNAPREKMPIAKRAKQFMPFAALTGLEAALRQKEWEMESRQKARERVEK